MWMSFKPLNVTNAHNLVLYNTGRLQIFANGGLSAINIYKGLLLVLILTTYCGQIYCKVLAGAASVLTNGELCHMWRVLVRANLKEGFAMPLLPTHF